MKKITLSSDWEEISQVTTFHALAFPTTFCCCAFAALLCLLAAAPCVRGGSGGGGCGSGLPYLSV